MSTEQIRDTARRIFEEIINQRKLAQAAELISADYILHAAGAPTPINGVEGWVQFVSTYLTGFPDLQFRVEDLIVEGDKAALRYTATGTQNGPMMDIPPTGKKATVTGIVISRHDQAGKAVEGWLNVDALGMLQQLGVIPMPSQTQA
jgi:predicted ester cyclase